MAAKGRDGSNLPCKKYPVCGMEGVVVVVVGSSYSDGWMVLQLLTKCGFARSGNSMNDATIFVDNVDGWRRIRRRMGWRCRIQWTCTCCCCRRRKGVTQPRIDLVPQLFRFGCSSNHCYRRRTPTVALLLRHSSLLLLGFGKSGLASDVVPKVR